MNLSFAFLLAWYKIFFFLLKDRVREEGDVGESWLGSECLAVKKQVILLYLK